MASYGLKVTDTETKVPLKDITVNVHIEGFVANVTNKLTYKNDETNPIEATFVFPLDELSAIYRFEALIEGRLIIGECQDKSQAQQTYQDAIEAGQSAFLLEESDASGDVFECLVGNIPPDTEVEITFAYALELAVLSDGRVKFVYPAVLGPRYGTPVENTAAASAVLTSKFGPKRLKTAKGPKLTYVDSEDISYTFHFEAEVESPSGIAAVHIEDGANHSGFTTEISGKAQNSWKLKLNSDEYKYHFDYDIELLAKYSQPFQPSVILGKGNPNKDGILKKDVAMLNFCPKLSEEGSSTSGPSPSVQTGEFIFVIDRSGSMGGDRIISAQKALEKFLEALPADCYFNILSFGSAFDALFTGGSEKNSEATMKRAVSLQKSLQANYGGTEMVRPFTHLYSWKAIKGYQKQVFLLTDGCIWNTPELFKLVKQNAHTTRVFTFGIGHGASSALVKGVARAGRGKAEFITDNLKALPEKVSYILSRAQQPYVSDVQLAWKTPTGLTVTTLPQHIPPVFFGEKLIVYGVISVGGNCKAKSQHQCKAVLTGNLGKEKLRYTLDFVIGGERGKGKKSSKTQDVDDAMSIHRLAAKAQIKELEDDEQGEGNKPQITLLSTSANVISKYTAFVGVDHGRKDKITGEMETRDVPLAELKKAKVKAAPPPQAGPSFYGGGSSDCPLVDKYINGKTVSAIPEVKVSDFDIDMEGDAAVLGKNIALDDAVVEANDTNLKEFYDDNEDGKELGEESVVKQPPRKRVKLTHVKEHKAIIPLSLLRYAPWTDGYNYPVEKITDMPNRGRTRSMVRVRFCDGLCKVVPQHNVVSAAKFCAGDVVSVKNAPNRYKFAVVLEYCEEDDGLIVACKDGLVCRFQAHYLVIPKATALKLRSREKSTFNPVMLCTIPLPQSWGQDPLKVTTSDLAELNLEGWINDTIVQFSLAQMWTKVLSEEQRLTCSFFSPLFYHSLSQELAGRKKYTRQTEKGARFEKNRRWTETMVDLASREWLFIPIFDEIHWYVIAIKLNKEWDGNDQIVKFHYIVMDSYFTADRSYEIMLIHNFLTQVGKDQGLVVNAKSRTTYPSVPIQENLSDCGICMLLCIDKCFEDNLDPAPHPKWWSPEEPDRKRQEIAKDVMEIWLRQSAK